MSRSRAALAAFLLAASAPAVAARPAPSAGAPRSGPPYWFKTYSTAPYKEFWSGTLTVKDFARALPAVEAAVKTEDGTFTAPLGDFAGSGRDRVQQLSFTLPLDRARALLARLRRLGDLPPPGVRASGAPIPLQEVREKIARIMKEKEEHAADLARVPAAAEAQEEILEHLLLVEAVAQSVRPRAYFDLTVRAR